MGITHSPDDPQTSQTFQLIPNGSSQIGPTVSLRKYTDPKTEEQLNKRVYNISILLG